MKLKNNPMEDFGGFELDVSAMELHSVDKWKIVLPYHGPLPKQMSPVSKAYIHISVQPVHGARCVLVADLDSGKRLRRSLEATNEQVMSLMDRFFAIDAGHPARPQDTGLAPRQLGIEECGYSNWRMLATDFKRLGKMADRLTTQQKSWLRHRLKE